MRNVSKLLFLTLLAPMVVWAVDKDSINLFNKISKNAYLKVGGFTIPLYSRARVLINSKILQNNCPDLVKCSAVITFPAQTMMTQPTTCEMEINTTSPMSIFSVTRWQCNPGGKYSIELKNTSNGVAATIGEHYP